MKRGRPSAGAADSPALTEPLGPDDRPKRPFWKDPVFIVGAAVNALILIPFFGYLAWSYARSLVSGDASDGALALQATSSPAAQPKAISFFVPWDAPNTVDDHDPRKNVAVYVTQMGWEYHRAGCKLLVW
jgi:hypothetical protein